MSAETPETTGLREAVEALADWMGEMDESHNVFDMTDEATTVITIDVETLAERIASRTAALIGQARAEGKAERDRLAHWKAEALPVLDGLQGIGKALDLPPGTRVTGPQALEAIEALLAERDRLAAAVERVEALADEWDRNYAAMLVGGFSGCSVGADTAAKRLRAALSDAGRGE